MHSRLKLVSIASILASVASAQPRQQFAVGYQFDRATPSSAAMSIWYPATGTPGTGTITTAEYLATQAPAGQLDRIRADFLVGIARSYGGARGLPSGREVPPLPDSVKRSVLDHVWTATLHAPPRQGRFPLVLLTTGLGSAGAADANILAETLAARGYVVVTGEPLSVPPGIEFGEHMRRYTAHADSVLAVARQLPNVDSSRFAAIDPAGHIALVLEARRPRWRAVVSFDEMPFADGDRDAIIGAASRIRMPMLYVPLGDAPNAAVFASLTSARQTPLRVPGATHGVLSQYGPWFLRQLGGTPALHDAVVAGVLDYLDRELAR